MKSVRRVALANDLSGFGRCSLTVAMPVLAAMGFQPCPVPTMLLSAHTGYVSPYIADFTTHIGAYLQHWEQMELTFDGAYTGFLGNEKQIEQLLPLLQRTAAQGGLRLVDPAMADYGRLYATCTPALVEEMKKLVGMSSVTTPNLTEVCLFTGEDYDRLLAMPAAQRRIVVENMGRQLLDTGCGAVVVTGVPEGDSLANMVMTKGTVDWVCTRRVDRNFAGTGDVFSSVLFGYLLRGTALTEAVRRTADFVGDVTAYTAALGTPEQDGVAFEPFLARLWEREL